MTIMFPKPAMPAKKPYAGLKRNTPLKAKTGLKSYTSLKAKTKLKCRPNGGHHYGKDCVKTGYCEICGKYLGGNTCWHHIVFRSQGGGDERSNLLEVGYGVPWICDCHGKIHRGEIDIREVLSRR